MERFGDIGKEIGQFLRTRIEAARHRTIRQNCGCGPLRSVRIDGRVQPMGEQ
jgi:hypothetical protein